MKLWQIKSDLRKLISAVRSLLHERLATPELNVESPLSLIDLEIMLESLARIYGQLSAVKDPRK